MYCNCAISTLSFWFRGITMAMSDGDQERSNTVLRGKRKAGNKRRKRQREAKIEMATTAPNPTSPAAVLTEAWADILTPATVNTSTIIQAVVREQQLLNLQVWELTEKLREAANNTTSQQKEVEHYVARLKTTKARADALNKQLLVIKNRLIKVHERLRARTMALKRDNDTLREELTEEKRSAALGGKQTQQDVNAQIPSETTPEVVKSLEDADKTIEVPSEPTEASALPLGDPTSDERADAPQPAEEPEVKETTASAADAVDAKTGGVPVVSDDSVNEVSQSETIANEKEGNENVHNSENVNSHNTVEESILTSTKLAEGGEVDESSQKATSGEPEITLEELDAAEEEVVAMEKPKPKSGKGGKKSKK